MNKGGDRSSDLLIDRLRANLAAAEPYHLAQRVDMPSMLTDESKHLLREAADRIEEDNRVIQDQFKHLEEQNAHIQELERAPVVATEDVEEALREVRRSCGGVGPNSCEICVGSCGVEGIRDVLDATNTADDAVHAVPPGHPARIEDSRTWVGGGGMRRKRKNTASEQVKEAERG